MYTENELLLSLEKTESTRGERLTEKKKLLSAEEKTELLKNFHPDYCENNFETLKIGVSAGERVPKELASLLYAEPYVFNLEIDLGNPDITTDILIIGGGGAGCAAALAASDKGVKVTLATKLRLGDSNTVMAEGGIQAADRREDSPMAHFIDTMGGGGFCNDPELVKELVLSGAPTIKWLESLGVGFDKRENGDLIENHGGGTSFKRMHCAKDYTGLEIMRVLKNEVLTRDIEILEYTSAVEILTDGKTAVGAVLFNILTDKPLVVKSKCVITATGGAGRLYYGGFPTSNHYGATADGMVMCYRAGAGFVFADSLQYHPTGVAYPDYLKGSLVTEKVRSLGADLVNKNGDSFINRLDTRDAVCAAVIKECAEGRGVYDGNIKGVWLDIPEIEIKQGVGTVEKKLPNMFKMFISAGIDIRKYPVLVYPTLHYQNGGIKIDVNGMTEVNNLYAAGELAGGIHGRNRLMGNSLLDILVFGRKSGSAAAESCAGINYGILSLNGVKSYFAELKKTGITENSVSPELFPEII